MRTDLCLHIQRTNKMTPLGMRIANTIMKHVKYCMLLFAFVGISHTGVSQIALHGLFTPVHLNEDTTFIYVRDYLPNLDYSKITLPNGLVRQSSGIDTLILTGSPSQKLSTIDFMTPGGKQSLVLIRSNKKKASISISAKSIKGKDVKIIGSFNNWNRESESIPLTKRKYLLELQLEPGTYEYKLVVDGAECNDPDNSELKPNGMGGMNNILHVKSPDGAKPESFKVSTKEEDPNAIYLHGANNNYLVFWNNEKIGYQDNTPDPKVHTIRIPSEAKTLKRSYIKIYSFRGDHQGADLLIPLDNGQVINSTDELERSDWHQARMYFLMIDRFQNGTKDNDLPTPDPEIQPLANYMGGDLLGVDQKIKSNFFDSIGVNTIWLSPITQGPLDAWGYWDKGEVKSKFSAYHGYWPVSNIKVDFRFGTNEEVHQLLRDAHERNENVILDYVANHVHLQHPIYKNNPDWATPLYLPDGTKNTEKWDEQRLTTWFDDHLPTLDLRRKEVVDPLVDSALFWVKEFSFDGFRHDATKHIDELYWRTLSYRIKMMNGQPFYQIGETYGSPQLINSYISTGMLDAQFDFNLYDASVAAFANSEGSLSNLKERLEQGLSTYGHHHLMGNISGNQDRARFISLSSGELRFDEDAKLAGWDREIGKPQAHAYERLGLLHAFNIAVPGIPCIYYGDEYGLPGAGDPDNRRMMKFDSYDADEAELLSHVSSLYQLRGTQLPLIYGSTEVTLVSDHVLMISRRYFQDEIKILINNSDEVENLQVEGQWNTLVKSDVDLKMSDDETSYKLELGPRSFIYLSNF